MRAFLGLPLPLLDGVRALLEDLRACPADLKVVDAARFHLTLKFLGEVPEETAHRFADSLRKQSLPGPFEIRMRDVGAFPGWKKMNVLWVGLEDATGHLAELHAAAERASVELGFPPEDRAFLPHVTLARKRTDRGIASAKDILSRHRGEGFGTAPVNRVNVYRSTLSPQGPTYEAVEAIPL